MRIKQRLYCLALIGTFLLPARALALEAEELTARSAVLIEAETGRVLYEKSAYERMYPASTTKILTAMLLLDYYELDDLVVTGIELYDVPRGSSKAEHLVGESITVRNLLRGLFIPSGNDTANVVVAAVTRKHTENASSLSFSEQEAIFAGLMNKKAEELGLTGSHFVNAHGFHDPEHYTTAYDIAEISRAALEYEAIAQAVQETYFQGDGAEGFLEGQEGFSQESYNWRTHNDLIDPDSPYYYTYATGIKTGFTDEAGNCLAASAEKDGVTLIAVVLFSAVPDRWEDTVKLFEYGYGNYSFITFQQQGEAIEEMPLSGQAWGEEESIAITAQEGYREYLTHEEAELMTIDILWEDGLVDQTEEGVFLLAPVTKGQTVAAIRYTLNGEVLHESLLLADGDIAARSFSNDMQFIGNFIKTNAFTIKAAPVYAALVLIIVAVIVLLHKKRAGARYPQYKLPKR